MPEMLDSLKLWNMAAKRFRSHADKIDDLMRHQIIRELVGLEVSAMIHDSAKHRIEEIRGKVAFLSYNRYHII
jgi:hypothetical protein